MYAKTASDGKPHKTLTCLIVDRDSGVETQDFYGLMGCRGGGGAGRIVFKDARIPKTNVVGTINGAYAVFNTMIPERLGTAAMTIGDARPALDVTTGYSSRRKAFGTTINSFQGVSFQIADVAMLLDASRAMVYATCTAVDCGESHATIRRMVSQTKKFVTESCQRVVHHAMQVMGGIGYTNVYPVERIVCDLRLASIWTGTNEVMSMIIANEWYRSHASKKADTVVRNWELDAAQADAVDEKIYE